MLSCNTCPEEPLAGLANKCKPPEKIKLVTIAMLMTCVKGYGVVPTECELSVRRGAGPTLLQNINTIKDMTDNQKESFSVTPLKNNHENIVKLEAMVSSSTGSLNLCLINY